MVKPSTLRKQAHDQTDQDLQVPVTTSPDLLRFSASDNQPDGILADS